MMKNSAEFLIAVEFMKKKLKRRSILRILVSITKWKINLALENWRESWKLNNCIIYHSPSDHINPFMVFINIKKKG